MNVLIDTHALIWFITNDDKLSSLSRDIIENSSNTCLVSIASLWEMGIKFSLGKLELRTELKRAFQIIDESGFEVLPIAPNHILTNAALAFHHRDPFDRIIIAQAKCEGFKVISKDRDFRKYDIDLIWN
jgi:PIN domain nuclease of toxin-antitoxin system